jgi:hypothetical protein
LAVAAEVVALLVVIPVALVVEVVHPTALV